MFGAYVSTIKMMDTYALTGSGAIQDGVRRTLTDDLYDVGFAQSDEVGDGILAKPIWRDPLMVVVPARHPILSHKRIPLEEVLRYPLVMCDPVVCEGHARQIARVLRAVDAEPLVAEQVASLDLMMALVSAGFALGLSGASQIAASREPGIVARPLAGRSPMLITYLLRLDGDPFETLSRFIQRVGLIDSHADSKRNASAMPDIQEEMEP
ncbi:LysR family substrate-binding domain-containing protein [Alcaligenaceae bacterium]|nr:LysR family substrate-binding domain-containing protein [Alcaligenaceae bacterium]